MFRRFFFLTVLLLRNERGKTRLTVARAIPRQTDDKRFIPDVRRLEITVDFVTKRPDWLHVFRPVDYATKRERKIVDRIHSERRDVIL